MGEPLSLREQADQIVERTADQAATALEKRSASRKGLNPLLLIAPAAGQGFDAYSTQQALKAGGREANPAMAGIVDNPAKLYGTKLLFAAGTALAAEALAKSGHRTLGKIVAGVGTAVPIAAGIHNMEIAGRSQ